jgi:prepilin-type processing-associated H-X9-DG protein
LRLIDNQTFQIGPPREFEKLMAMPTMADGPLSSALAKAANAPVFAAFNAAAIPEELRAQIPAPAVPIAKLKFATLAVSLEKTASIDVRLTYPDDSSAADAEQMLHTVIEMGRSALVGARAELDKMLTGDSQAGNLQQMAMATGALVGLGAIREYEELLKTIPLKREASEIALKIDVPTGMHANMAALSAVGAATLVPAVQKVREAAGSSQSANNLKQMGIALHNYNDVNGGKLPAHAIYSKDGKTPLLSWRVAILPYLEQAELYSQFRLDEPWDSEHNKKLIPLMPKLYMSPQAPPSRGPGTTYYQVFVGGGAPWEYSAKAPGLPRSFPDGLSNTFMIAEAGDPVIWTKPADLTYDPKKPLPRLGNVWQPRGFNVAFGDGSVRMISPRVTEANLRGAITAAGS